MKHDGIRLNKAKAVQRLTNVFLWIAILGPVLRPLTEECSLERSIGAAWRRDRLLRIEEGLSFFFLCCSQGYGQGVCYEADGGAIVLEISCVCLD